MTARTSWSHLDHGWGVGADDHAVGDLGGAGEREAAHALDFDGAGAAAGVGGQAVEVAEVGDREAGVLDHLDQRRAVGSVNGLAVDGDRGHAWSSPAAGTNGRRAVYQQVARTLAGVADCGIWGEGEPLSRCATARQGVGSGLTGGRGWRIKPTGYFTDWYMTGEPQCRPLTRSATRSALTFAALADPTRRAILTALADGESTVTALAEPFDMTLPAVSKHLKVLERAQLIERSSQAQWRPCRLAPEPLKDVADWVEHYRDLWEQRFDRLDDYLSDLQGSAGADREREARTVGNIVRTRTGTKERDSDDK